MARDFMNESILVGIINKYSHQFDMIHGNVNHAKVSGNCLEGLIIRIKNNDNKVAIKKYKFPECLIRTMLYREKMREFIFTKDLKNEIKYFIDTWCISDEGKHYWYKMALQVFVNYINFKS